MPTSARVVPGEGSEFHEPPQKSQSPVERFVERVLDSPLVLSLLVVACLFPLVIFVVFPLPVRAHLILSLVLVAAGLITSARFPHMRMVVVVLSLAASFRYILYRGTETLALGNWYDGATSVLLYIAELYALLTLIGGYFQTAITRRNLPVPLDGISPDTLPTVDIFIPTYDEEDHVLRPTVLGAVSIEYPNKRVWVLDDGRKVQGEGRAWVEELCREVGAEYVGREDSKGAKAGNVNNALQYASGDLVAFFDADHVPVRDFLNATVGFFVVNEDVALVQTPHHFYNPDPFLRNLYIDGIVPPEGHLFYHGIQLGNDFWNSAFFCGSCAVMRREALDEVGGFTEITVTEDAHTALQLHSRGWESVFLDVPLAAGLATETYAAHIGQRIRWARGMAQIFRLDNPLIKPGLSLAQRINYFQASWYFLFGLPRLIFVMTPALYLLLDLHPLDANVREVLVYAVPHLVLAGIGSVTMNRNVRHSLWPEVYEVAIAPYTTLVTTMALLFPRRGTFNVTAKGDTFDSVRFDFRNTFPLLIVLGVLVGGFFMVPFKIQKDVLDVDTILVAAAWNAYNFVVVTAAVLAALERPQRRRFHRVERAITSIISAVDVNDQSWFEPLEAISRDLSMGGVQLEIAGQHDIPVSAQMEFGDLRARGVQPLPLRPVSVEYDSDRDLTIVRGDFAGLSSRQQSLLATEIFGATNAWSTESFRFDSYWRSFMSVLVAILSVGLGNPAWLRRWAAPRGNDQVAPLVPGVEEMHCISCEAPLLEGAAYCEVCGAAQPVDEHEEPAELEKQRALPGLRPLIFPVALLLLAVTLALGYRPVVEHVSRLVPLNKWDRVPYQTRKGELAQAYHRIDAMHVELARNVKMGTEPDPRYSRRLWDIKRDYNFQALEQPSRNGDASEVDLALKEAVDSLEDARRHYDPRQRERGAVIADLELAKQHLDRAANRLGIPL